MLELRAIYRLNDETHWRNINNGASGITLNAAADNLSIYADLSSDAVFERNTDGTFCDLSEKGTISCSLIIFVF